MISCSIAYLESLDDLRFSSAVQGGCRGRNNANTLREIALFAPQPTFEKDEIPRHF